MAKRNQKPKEKKQEDAFEQSGRIFLGEAQLAASTQRVSQRLSRREKAGLLRYLKPLLFVAALALVLFGYFSRPTAAVLGLEERLEQALHEPISLVVLGERMGEGSLMVSQTSAFKTAYKAQAYEQAAVELSRLLAHTSAAQQLQLTLYAADIKLKTARFEEALEQLSHLKRDAQQLADADLLYCVDYYIALAHLGLGEQQKAKPFLDATIHKGGKLAAKAGELTEALEN